MLDSQAREPLEPTAGTERTGRQSHRSGLHPPQPFLSQLAAQDPR